MFLENSVFESVLLYGIIYVQNNFQQVWTSVMPTFRSVINRGKHRKDRLNKRLKIWK